MRTPKYREISDQLAREIRSGKYRGTQKLPSEAMLVEQFGTSRITVGRALRELTQQGLIRRVAGSGSFVRESGAATPLFGLLIPNLGETEIFEPICRGMADAPEASSAGLLWGHTDPARSRSEQAVDLCRQFVQRGVSGVFFAPLEGSAQMDEVNSQILHELENAGIPTVLLDRDIAPFPFRSAHDLIGVDNRRAAFLAATHLLDCGARRTAFVEISGTAATAGARRAGYREAVQEHHPPIVYCVESINSETVRTWLSDADAFLCINDRTAGRLMQSVLQLGYRVPDDIQIAGIDDVEYARLLPVPLTTIRQPCRAIGEAAMSTLIERLARPDRLTRDVLLECELVVRQSTRAR